MRDTGVAVPALESKPVLEKRWKYPMEVYAMLSGSRRYSMGGAAPIPLSEYVAFTKIFNIRGWHAWEVWEDVRTIDRLKLEAAAKQRAAVKENKK